MDAFRCSFPLIGGQLILRHLALEILLDRLQPAIEKWLLHVAENDFEFTFGENMGNGIAHVFAKSEFEVILCDVQQPFLDRGLQTIKKNLEREVTKNKLTADQGEAATKRIHPTLDRKELAACDIVVEAASEKFE